jgi:hypothetical protein
MYKIKWKNIFFYFLSFQNFKNFYLRQFKWFLPIKLLKFWFFHKFGYFFLILNTFEEISKFYLNYIKLLKFLKVK